MLRRSYFENGFLLILRVKKDKGGKHLKVPNLSDLYVLYCTKLLIGVVLDRRLVNVSWVFELSTVQ